MGAGFNRTGRAMAQRGPDVLTGHCGANRVWERKRSISTLLRTGSFLYPTLGKIPDRGLPSKRQKMRNLHIHRYCKCNMLLLLIMKNPMEGASTLFQELYVHHLIQQSCKVSFIIPTSQVSPFMLRTYLPCPKMFSGLNVTAKSEPRLPDSRSVLQSPCNDRSYKKDRTPGWLSHCY